MDDVISRQAAIDEAYSIVIDGEKYDVVQVETLMGLPSAQQDCTECPEYDHDTHSCPRYCEVIRKTVEEVQPERKTGRWIEHNPHKWGLGIVFECSECGEKIDCEPSNFCPNCGADMRTPVEIARNIVHKVIDNSVWSDTVDTANMHKVVDDKYAEIRGDTNVDANT